MRGRPPCEETLDAVLKSKDNSDPELSISGYLPCEVDGRPTLH